MNPLTLSIALSLSLLGSGFKSQPQTIQRATRHLRASHVFAHSDYRTYTNARFGYSISYPASVLVPQGESDNGDGQIFRSRDGHAEMRVFGRYNVQNETLHSA